MSDFRYIFLLLVLLLPLCLTFSLTREEIVQIIRELERAGFHQEAQKYRILLKKYNADKNNENLNRKARKKAKKSNKKSVKRKDKVYRRSKDVKRVYRELVIWKYVQEDPKRAINMLSGRPKTPKNLKALGIAYYNLGDYLKAIEYLSRYSSTKAFRRDKDRYRIYLLLAYAYNEVLDEKNFRKYMLKVYRYRPDVLSAKDKLSVAYIFLRENRLSEVRKIVNSLSDREMSELKKEDLLNLYALYYVKRGFQFLKKGDYERAYAYAEKSQTYKSDLTEAKELKAWALLNLEDYKEALRLFKDLLKTKRSPDIYYGIALAHLGTGNRKKAEEFARLAQKDADRLLLYKIARLYYDIGEREKALAIIQQLKGKKPSHEDEPLEREKEEDYIGVEPREELREHFNLLPQKKNRGKIDRSFRRERKQRTSIEIGVLEKRLLGEERIGARGGVFSSFKDGVRGSSALATHKFTLEAFKLRESDISSYELSGGLNAYYLDSGTPSDSEWINIGLGSKDPSYKGSVSGVSPYLSIYYKHYKGLNGGIFLSTTPIGFVLSPKLVYTLRLGYGKSYVEAYRKPVIQSLLSFSGNKVASLKWGRVVEEGLGIKAEVSSNSAGVAFKGRYAYSIKGENTLKNKAVKGTLLLYLQLHNLGYSSRSFEHLIFGPILIYEKYDKNTDFYTFGHGGYFSPQRFTLFGLFGDGKKKLSERTTVRLSTTVGFLSFKEEPAKKFPFDPASPYYRGKRENTLGYSLRGYIIHLLNSRLGLTGMVTLDRSKNYTLFGLGGFLTYYFREIDHLLEIDDLHVGRYRPFEDMF